MKRFRGAIEKLSVEDWKQRVENGGIFVPRGKMQVTPDGELVTCHLCDRGVQALAGKHVQAHGLTAAEFRGLLGLNNGEPLWAPNVRGRMRDFAQENEFYKRIEPKQVLFTSGSEKSIKASKQPRRLQGRVNLGDARRIAAAKLMEGKKLMVSDDTGSANKRRVTKGGFSALGQHFHFNSKSSGVVEIAVEGDNLVARGELKGGEIMIRSYPLTKD